MSHPAGPHPDWLGKMNDVVYLAFIECYEPDIILSILYAVIHSVYLNPIR